MLPFQDREAELRGMISELLGQQPEKVQDVWVWRVGPGRV